MLVRVGDGEAGQGAEHQNMGEPSTGLGELYMSPGSSSLVHASLSLGLTYQTQIGKIAKNLKTVTTER